jgi:hypothetical protein
MRSVRSRLREASANLLDVLGAAVEADGLAGGGIDFPSELGGDHHAIPDGLQRLADKFLVGERAVDLGGVEKRHSFVHGGTDDLYHFLLVPSGAVAMAHAHAAEADG